MSWYHEKPKDEQQGFTARNFVAFLGSRGIYATNLRRGADPPDFTCTISGVDWSIEVTLADARLPEVFPAHVERVRSGVPSMTTTSANWDLAAPLYVDPFVSARNDLKGEIRRRVDDKCGITFAHPARTYVVIDASLFPFASVAQAESFAAEVRAEVRVPGGSRLAGVYFALVMPDWSRRHYALAF